MSKLILVSKNAGIVSKDELKEFADEIQEATKLEVQFNTPEHLGTQVTPWEVVELWIGKEVAKETIKVIVPAAIKTFSEWARKRRGKEKKPRPKSFTIFGPDGKVVSSNVVNESGEIEDQTKKDRQSIGKRPNKSEPFS